MEERAKKLEEKKFWSWCYYFTSDSDHNFISTHSNRGCRGTKAQ
jgi:hypothetical protein